MKLTQERLKSLIYYDSDDGTMIWINTKQPAERFEGLIEIDGKSYEITRLAWLYVDGFLPYKVHDGGMSCAWNEITYAWRYKSDYEKYVRIQKSLDSILTKVIRKKDDVLYLQHCKQRLKEINDELDAYSS